MKKLLIIIIVLTVVSGASYAQRAMTQEERKEMMARHQAYMEELNLTEEQKPRVEEINMTYFKALSNLRNSSASRMEKYRTFKDISSTRDRDMKKVLTKEQYAIYKENQQEQRDNFRERRRKN